MPTLSKNKILTLILAACMATVLMVTGCAPNADGEAEEGKKNDPGLEASATEWSPDTDCAACHSAEASSAGETGALYSTHSVHESMSACADCHVDKDGSLAKAHNNYTSEKAKPPTKLNKTDVSEDVCTTGGCHSISDLVAATSDYQGLADSNGLAVNPHEMVEDEHHKVGGSANADIQCSSCHKMHENGGAESKAVLDTALTKCITCHHAEVFECNTCH